jgi:pilus assembly protein CpaE
VAPEIHLVLLVCADRDAASRLAALVASADRRIVAAPFGPAALARAPEARLIVLDGSGTDEDAGRAVLQLRALPAVTGTPILCLAASDEVDERVRLLEAGADDVLSRSFHPDELRARVDALLAVLEVTGDSAAPPVPEVPVRTLRRIVFFSPKGGAGTTTLAVNSAILAARHGRPVALVDLDLEWGQVATHLNVAPRFSVVELARDGLALEDPEIIRSYPEMHSSGVAVFAAPPRPDQAELLGQEHVRRLLDGLSSAYDLIIVDGGSGFDERTLSLVEESDRFVVVLVPEIAGVRAVHTLLEALADQGTAEDRVFLVLNHIFEHDMLRDDDLERSVKANIDASLPYDPIAYIRAVNEGVPVLTNAGRGAAPENMAHLVESILELQPDSGAKTGGSSPRFRLSLPGRRK